MANESMFIGHSSGNRIKLGKRFGRGYDITVTNEQLQEFFDDCAISQSLDDFTLFGEWTCEPYQSKTFPLMSDDEFEAKCKGTYDNYSTENIVVGNVWLALDNLYITNPICNCTDCTNQYKFTDGIKLFKNRTVSLTCPKCKEGKFDLFRVSIGGL